MSGGVCAGMAFCAVVFDFFEALYGFFVYGAAGSLPGGGKRGFAEAQKEQKAAMAAGQKRRTMKGAESQVQKIRLGAVTVRPFNARFAHRRRHGGKGAETESAMKRASKFGKNSAKLFGNAFGAGPCAFLLICERAACCRAEDICLRFFCIKYSIRLKGFRKAVQISVCRKIPSCRFLFVSPSLRWLSVSGQVLGVAVFCFLSPRIFHVEFCIDCLVHFRRGFVYRGLVFMQVCIGWAAVWRLVFSLSLADFYDGFLRLRLCLFDVCPLPILIFGLIFGVILAFVSCFPRRQDAIRQRCGFLLAGYCPSLRSVSASVYPVIPKRTGWVLSCEKRLQVRVGIESIIIIIFLYLAVLRVGFAVFVCIVRK